MNRTKFKLKLTGWGGTCNYRTQFKFMSSFDKEKAKLKSHKQGIYQCLDCSELKVFELPERI